MPLSGLTFKAKSPQMPEAPGEIDDWKGSEFLLG
jgi:hypothetical protein